MPKSSIHKQGYLFKQGTYFSSWSERYFSLESSILKQFPDAETAVPSHSIYLGSAAVEGVFSPLENEDHGFGAIYSLVMRWPLPQSPDPLEEQWGYMHIGSYEKAEIEDWFDSISALIKVEQTRRLLGNHGREISSIVPVTRMKPQLTAPVVPTKYTVPLERFVSLFNTSSRGWTLLNSHDGMLYQSTENSRLWKFTTLIKSTSSKRVWESMFSETAGEWEPQVKHASTILSVQEITTEQIMTDRARMQSELWSVQAVCELDRFGLKDEKTGVFLVVGSPVKDVPSSLAVDSVGWAVETLTDKLVMLTMIFEFSKFQVGLVTNFTGEKLAEIFCSHSRRSKEFILSQ